jgi:molybdenum cofactor sulfurtransferase
MENNLDQRRQRAEEDFLAAWPEYESTRELDALRAAEYSRLDRLGHVYLDYTGSGLHSSAQLREHTELLESTLLANPHSVNPTSLAATQRVESCRAKALSYFNASPDEYVAIFTANASHALKLVGEAFPFSASSRYLLTFDNHNSVNGIREFARARGAEIAYAELTLPDLRVDEEELARALAVPPAGPNLFAYPAQSNFSGVQHPLEWIAAAQEKGWTTLLDAAAFVPTNRLDLSQWHPDFVSLSFYKMFGYPTGVGCLLARREALAKLRRPWFSGGVISVASVQGDCYSLHEGASGFEDGTVDFLGIPGVEIGLRHLERVGVERIRTRCHALAGWLIRRLLEMRHPNGAPMARIYGPTSMERRGGIVTCNFYTADGAPVNHRVVEEAAAARKISLRTGCFCNPGDGEVALELSKDMLAGCLHRQEAPIAARLTEDDFRLCVTGSSPGAVRISFGIASNFADAFAFVESVPEFVGA